MMTWDIMSSSTVFQSYQDDGQVIMKGCLQWNPIYDLKYLPQVGLKPRTARSAGQSFTHWANGAPM